MTENMSTELRFARVDVYNAAMEVASQVSQDADINKLYDTMQSLVVLFVRLMAKSKSEEEKKHHA